MAVKVNTDSTDTDKALGLYFVGLLNQLGYKATLQALSADIQYPYIQNSKNKVQIAFSDWFQDYPAASDFLNILLGCNSIHPNSNSSPNIAQFCNKAIQAQMDHAGQVGITDPAAANKIWAAGGQGGHRPGAVGRDVQPEVHRLPLLARQGLRVQPAVVLPPRSGLGEVTREEHARG